MRNWSPLEEQCLTSGERFAVRVGLTDLETEADVQPVGSFSRRTARKLYRLCPVSGGDSERCAAERFAHSFPAGRGIDDDIVDPRSHTSGDSKNGEGESADDSPTVRRVASAGVSCCAKPQFPVAVRRSGRLPSETTAE
jgi:hypothetical protein